MDSIWKQGVKLKKREPLSEDKEIDTVVIGAGITGILTAYFLQQKGIKVIVVEADRICGGQTGNTTAKITIQHGLFYHKIMKKVGMKRTKLYAKANEEALFMYEQVMQEEKMECEYERLSSYLYTTEEKGMELLKKEANTAKTLEIEADLLDGNRIRELPFTVKGALAFPKQARFHPLKFVATLANKLEIYENTKTLSVKKHKVITNKGIITAQNIVFATHYPITNIPGFYFLRQHQERSYVLGLKTEKPLAGMYYSIDREGISLRSEGDVLLLGGGSHRTGAKIKEEMGYTALRKTAKKYYPNAEEVFAWSAQDCMSHDQIPFIGKYSIIRPYWYVATGFKKWGMTTAMVAAMLISDEICQIPNAYEKVFSPQRFLIRASIKNLFVDMGESILGLGKGLISKKEKRCPHMGCKLEWNCQDGSYDCPCHGSRFSEDGQLIDNPAQVDKR